MKKKLPEENSLWKYFIHGDDDAFSAIYHQYADILYAYGKRYVTEDDHLQDCIQELFIDIYKYRESLSPAVNIKFYLFSSLKRKINQSAKKIRLFESEIKSYDYLNSQEFNLTFNAEEAILLDEERAEYLKPLIKELNMLPAKQKEILYLRFNSNLEYVEIASLLGISVSSCRTMVYRAVKQLREKLENSTAKNLLFVLSIII